SDSGVPVIAVRPHGKGRVIAFGYRNAGLSWHMPMSARGYVAREHWEAFYALLCRALIYAAGREEDAAGEWKIPPPPAPGAKIEALSASRTLIAEGDSVDVTWRAAGPVRVELIDGLDRVIARTTGHNRVTLKAGRPLAHSGFVVAGGEKLPVRFAASNREWNDYEVIMPWYGPGSYQPWIPALDEQFRRLGITALATPERNFKIVASAGLHDVFGVYAYRNRKYAERKRLYAETRDKKYLTRDVVLQAPEFVPHLREQLEQRLRPLSELKPLAYYLADESSLTTYTDAFDVDWAPAALAGFREWLRREYGSLDALNASWAASFRDWQSVLPMTSEEAQKHGNFAPWADHRIYMEREFVSALEIARQIVREIDPGAPASISGTQVPTAHNGANWYEIDQRIDYLQPYSGGNQDAMHHLFRPGILLTGFTGYGSTGDAAHYQQWQRLFYGHTGASIFWHHTILNPDLTLSEQGQALAGAFGKIQSGIGRVFMDSRVREDGVAIHFSMASIRGAWITDGRISPRVGNVLGTSKNYAELVARRDAWVKQLERQGVQFRFLATPQIERGDLDPYKVLILPYSIALSDAEVRAIERFLARGGIVYADEQTGRMDERCRWRKPPALAGERKGLVRRGPGEVAVTPAFRLPGDFLITVRDFGGSRLIGALPRESCSADLPPAGSVRYDLLRGGIAGARLESSPPSPVLLLERSTRIAKLEITPALALRLTDETGAPVDRSVVHVEVFDPSGKLMRHYSANRTIRDGRASFAIPFALNDPRGKWRIRARDVVSGLTAERALER
ncbi:MAG: beta-galactosidase, partial [Acidobacteria bacterium]|nr:beta-galactosidase [Acidobacteriota bacterium]